ncbi:hypothetical protein SEUCBS139899_010669 [Sporothrix eucalyptigena]|uniref:DUF7730 domain-containing protein n=1 Tax=Sporothrix eucalyptigena TaxID=1812306 RepID=A0ABP0CF83_9PEZI
MQSRQRSRAQPPLLEHFTAATAPVAASPTTSTDGPASSTSVSQLPPPAQPANPQDGSLFFTRLPSEIRRMIYVEVWRTYGSDGYEGDDNGDGHESSHPHPGSTPRGGLSPHITAAISPSKTWMTSPLPGSGGGGSSSRSDGGTDDQQQQQRASLSPPWTRQIRGFTSAPCFLAVDDDEDRDIETHGSRTRHPPEADDVRPARLAAAHTADLDAAANSNGNSIWQGGADQQSDLLENATTSARQRQAPSSSTWRARWNSPWLGHWACEEYFTGAAKSGESSSRTASQSDAAVRSEDHRRRRPPLRRPYLPILMTCRRAYVEGIDLLYSTLTFQFTEMATAEGFLERWPCVSSVRLVMHLSTSLLDFYRHADDDDQGIITAGATSTTVPNDDDNDRGPGAVTIGTFPRHDDERDRGLGGSSPDSTVRGTVVNARNNAWQRLCAGLNPERLPNLRRLHVWVEAHDLRGWHKAAAEKRLFAKLLEAGGSGSGDVRRRLTADNFVLYLPTLPVDVKTRGLPGCYLGEEETTEENKDPNVDDRDRQGLPCTIVRTERPDYWDVHLNMRPVFVNRRMSIGSRVAALRRAGFL